MSNQGRRPPCDSMPLQTHSAPPGAPQVRRTLAGWCRPDRRRRLRGGLWPSLPPLGGLLPLHPQTPLRYARHCKAAVGGRRAPRRSRAALPACPPQPPVRRLLPLASVPPTGADEPPRSHSAFSRRGAAGGCCGGAPASQGGRCYRTFSNPLCRSRFPAAWAHRCTSAQAAPSRQAQTHQSGKWCKIF